MPARDGLCRTMMENGSLVGTGTVIAAGVNTTITGITTATAIIVIMTASGSMTVTSLKPAPGLGAECKDCDR